MASTPLTLAALATSAVPDLHIVGVRPHSDGGAADYTSVVIVTDGDNLGDDLIVRVPQNAAAEVRQSGELLGLAALADGARSSLPFAVPETRGITRAGDTRAVVSTFLTGGRITAHTIDADALLLQPLAEAIAAIHALPTSLVQQAGLPMRTADDVRDQASRLVARAAATRLLPETVHAKWLERLGNSALWDFAPTVIHGSLDADQLLVEDERITGILGWSELSAGDPALDLSWLLTAGTEVFDAVLSRYAVARGVGGLRELRARAMLHHELDIARWLLHGVEGHDEAIVDDAVTMLDTLVDRIRRAGAPVVAPTTLSEDEVQDLLDEVPDIPLDPRSETAEFEALDEDRAFIVDADFIDPPDDQPDSGDAGGSQPDSGDADLPDADLPDTDLPDADLPDEPDSPHRS